MKSDSTFETKILEDFKTDLIRMAVDEISLADEPKKLIKFLRILENTQEYIKELKKETDAKEGEID